MARCEAGRGRRGASVSAAGAALLAAMLVTNSCGSGSGSGDGAATARVACYPPCIAKLVKRCPLTSACQVNLDVGPPPGVVGESDGVAVCFASGEKQRLASDNVHNRDVVYVKAADGSECYEATGISGSWDVSVSGEVVASIDAQFAAGATIAVTCDGATTQVPTNRPECQRLPWDNPMSCTESTKFCTFGSTTATPVWSADLPMPGCDPATCTSPPADTCEGGSSATTAVTHDSPGTCGPAGCAYVESRDSCNYGCFNARCTGSLQQPSNVAAVVAGTTTPVLLTGGGTAPVQSAVTVTVRTLPRGAATQVSLVYTINQVSKSLAMTPDPSTPADQADYDQWTVDLPALQSFATVTFHMDVEGYGVIAHSYGPMLMEWSYTGK